MRVQTDDELYRVNRIWLGFTPTFSFIWNWRYSDYGVLLVTWLAGFLFARSILGFGISFWIIAWPFVGAIAVTKLVRAKFGYERSLKDFVTQGFREIALTGNAQRPKTQRTQRVTYTARHVRIRATRPCGKSSKTKNRARVGVRRKHASAS